MCDYDTTQRERDQRHIRERERVLRKRKRDTSERETHIRYGYHALWLHQNAIAMGRQLFIVCGRLTWRSL
jgi:hypothetical protein